MRKFISREAKFGLSSAGFPGSKLLAFMPLFVMFYVLLILPLMPDDGKGRGENILFWPAMAALTSALIIQNWARVDFRFFRSLPMVSLIAYFAFAAASVVWAYNPPIAFSRIVVELFLFIIVVGPYALPIRTTNSLRNLHICFVIALVVSGVYVLTIPPSPIGHPGYFTHKQELGLLAATGIILSLYELMFSGWRRILAIIAIILGFWLVFESQSKSALALSLVAIISSAVMLAICKRTRLTPAFIVAAVVLASMFISKPIDRIGYRLYGDATLTGRTGIWGFIDQQIGRKPWLGWGFHSYYFVPNSPQDAAPGYIREMPSSHSGYLELKLETGKIGYWIFLVFIYASLHSLEAVRRKDPLRAWCFLSIELFAVMINLLDSNWLILTFFWVLYLTVVAESVRYSLPSPTQAPGVQPVRIRSPRRLGRVARIAHK